MDAALLILGVVLVLSAFAPVAPSSSSTGTLRRLIRHQIHLWNRYLDELQRWR